MPLTEEEQRVKNALLAARYIEEYRVAGAMFFQQIEDFLTLPLDTLSPAQKANIYKQADRALAVSATLNAEENSFELVKCWQMVNLARNLAVADHKKKLRDPELVELKAKYLVGLRGIFTQLISQLPREMQVLKVFYTVGDYDSIDSYLTHYLEVNGEEEYAALVTNLGADITAASRERAAVSLNKRPGFANLAQEMREELIGQRAYMIRLRAFLDLSDLTGEDPLRKELYALSEQLEENIKNALENNRNLTKARADYKNIQDGIAKQEDAIMQRVFVQRVKERAPTAKTAGKAAGAGMLAWYLGLVSAPLLTIAATAAAAAIVGPARYEAKETMKAVELEESKQLAKELDPVDFLFINKIDEKWGKYTGLPVEKMRVRGDTAEQRIGKEIGQRIKENIQEPVSAATKTAVSTGLSILIALFTLTIAGLLLNLIILTILFPPLWPIWVVFAASAFIGLGAWQIMHPESRPADKIFRVASSITFYVATTFNLLMSPMRALTASIKQGRVLASAFYLVGGIVFGVFGVAMVPIVTPPMLVATILGFSAGGYLRLSFSQIMDRIFYRPVREIKEYNAANYAAKDAVYKELALTREQVARLEQLYPGISKELNEIFNDRLNELKQQLAQLRSGANLAEIEQLTMRVDELERVWKMIGRDIDNLINNDIPKNRLRLCNNIDNYLSNRFYSEREIFLEKAKARKNERGTAQPAAEPKAKPAEQKRGRMQFWFKTKATPAAETKKLIGASPSFKMKFATDYDAERAQLDKLTSLHTKMERVRAQLGN